MIRVVAIVEQGNGAGYDLTDAVEGLNWSSTDPGGDETCTFSLKRSWFANNPELARGNLLRIMDGVDVLWQGRVEEIDRGGDDTETLGVTAYGLGARLKDTTMREIYVDADLSKWGSIPNIRVANLGSSWATDAGGSEVHPDANGASVLSLALSRLANTEAQKGIIESWYDGAGIKLGIVVWNLQRLNVSATGGWVVQLLGEADQTGLNVQGSGNLGDQAGISAMVIADGCFFAATQLYYNGVFTGDGEWRIDLQLVVVGRHGLALQGSGVEVGLLASQLIPDAVRRASGITVRRVDPTAFVIRQSTYITPTKIEDAIVDMNRFDANRRTFGTWGPDSPLDNSVAGYFDYRSIDTEPTWLLRREDCDNCDLTSETATLFNAIEVTYTDSSGVARTVKVTAESPELNGIPRTESQDIGKATKAGAEAYGAAFLALSGSFAPARGSAVVSQPVRHLARGMLPPHYMRADGSAMQVAGILPASSVFALDATPNRRTTFPMKRVNVDASSKARPVVTIEVDQTNDSISALQARLAQDAEYSTSAAAITR